MLAQINRTMYKAASNVNHRILYWNLEVILMKKYSTASNRCCFVCVQIVTATAARKADL